MRWCIAVCVALSLSSAAAWAEPTRSVSTSRIHLDDVVSDAPPALAGVDLGPSPPPGGSKYLRRDDVLALVRASGLPLSGLRLPESVRIVAAKREIAPRALAELAREPIVRALPAGVKLVSVRPPPQTLTVRPETTVGRAELAQLPRRAGQSPSTATVELLSDGVVVARVPLGVVVDIGEEAARPDIQRGGTVRILLEMGAVVVQTTGVALSDGKVGDIIRVSVSPTRKIVRVLLVEPTLAKVVGT